MRAQRHAITRRTKSRSLKRRLGLSNSPRKQTKKVFGGSNANFLSAISGRAGLYVISPEYHPTEPFLVKIGVGFNLKHRIQQYLTYIPRGFNIYAIVFTSGESPRVIESLIHTYLTRKGRKAEFTHTHSEEWYHLRLSEIPRVIDAVVNGLEGRGSRVRHSVNISAKPYAFDTNVSSTSKPRIKPMSTPTKKRIDMHARGLIRTEPRPLLKKINQNRKKSGVRALLYDE